MHVLRTRSYAYIVAAAALVPLFATATTGCVRSRTASEDTSRGVNLPTVAPRTVSLEAPPPANVLDDKTAPVATAAAAPMPPAASVAFAPAAPPRPSSHAADLGGLGGAGSGLGSFAKREKVDGYESAPAGAPMAMGRSVYSAPAASIAAGEWNDNANYREFQKWLTSEVSLPFQHVDVSRRRYLVVRDESGRAVPGCHIDVADAQQNHVAMVTGASGRAVLFPRAERLGDGVTATATCDGGHVTKPVALEDSDGVVDLRLPVSRQLAATRTIDVAFILDTTGSMSEEIASVKSTIAKVAAGLGDGNVAVRIGLVEYKDRGDAFVTRVHPFASDVKGFAESVANLSAGGGGDTPESVNEGVHVALTGLDWQTDSVGHFAFLIGDAPPHLDYPQDYSYAEDMKSASHRGIQIFTIAASGMDLLGQVVFRQIAQYTGASNMFVLRGGAGPQSVGGGDPKDSCGGTHQQYSSGNLDALILGKIRGEMRALDGDPMRIAGLHEDEDAKPCDQRIGMQ